MRLALFTLTPLALAFGLAPRSARGAELDPEIQQMVARVDADHIGGTIQRLQNFGTRHACSTDARGARGISAARDWIAHRFARITQVVVATAASLARAPGAPSGLVAVGDAVNGATITWNPSSVGAVDHYVIAARSTQENFYRQRMSVNGTAQTISPSELGFNGGESFFVSVAAVDAAGHESLFAYPEFRCDAAGCAVPAGALDVTVRK
jgi:hypothetical protein